MKSRILATILGTATLLALAPINTVKASNVLPGAATVSGYSLQDASSLLTPFQLNLQAYINYLDFTNPLGAYIDSSGNVVGTYANPPSVTTGTTFYPIGTPFPVPITTPPTIPSEYYKPRTSILQPPQVSGFTALVAGQDVSGKCLVYNINCDSFNSFTISSNSSLYLPLFVIDDISANLPQTHSDEVKYFFDPNPSPTVSIPRFTSLTVGVDGQTPVDVIDAANNYDYLTLPVKDSNAPGDGYPATWQAINYGVFLSPLSPGTHTVTFSVAGSEFGNASISYQVTSTPEPSTLLGGFTALGLLGAVFTLKSKLKKKTTKVS